MTLRGMPGVAFTINIYDDDGNLLATSPNVVNDLGPGDAKSFASVLSSENILTRRNTEFRSTQKF